MQLFSSAELSCVGHSLILVFCVQDIIIRTEAVVRLIVFIALVYFCLLKQMYGLAMRCVNGFSGRNLGDWKNSLFRSLMERF